MSVTDLIPVSVLTGFLGSGKTTVLNRVLKHPGMGNTAVIVNEFGEIGIDHLLVETALDGAMLLESGCVCCSVRGDLVDTLEMLRVRRERGEIPRFERVVLETTGLADPAPVLQTLMTEPTVARRYRLNGIVATVDAVNGLDQLDREEIALKQAALAGSLLLTKTDLAALGRIRMLEARLRALNPTAPIAHVVNGEAAPGLLFDDGNYDPAAIGDDGADWLPEALEAPDHAHAHAHAHEGHVHGDDIRSFCLIRDRPTPWPALRTWLESLTSLRGSDLLRVKGIVNAGDSGGPLILHGVQHVFHPPRRLADWPDDDRRTRIVCITRGIGRESLSNALEASIEHFEQRKQG